MLPSGWGLWDNIIIASGLETVILMIRALAPLFVLLAAPAVAVTLDVPGNATMAAEEKLALGSYALPTGPFADGAIPSLNAEGEVTRQAWQIEAAGLSSLQILTPLRAQLVAAGFDILYECQTDACGGFDFRFGIDVMQAPDMYVDLGDFRYLSAQIDTPDGAEYVSLLVSRTSLSGFLQITRIGPATEAAALTTVTQAPVRATTTATPSDFAAEIEGNGRVILSDLTFEIGSAQLGPGPFASLQTLADYLLANPSRRVALVGHTDSQGALDANIALSKRRAGSVLERLVTDYGIPRIQLAAEGMGFLSPLASNLTPEGRDLNRRVEVIITSTE
jgi:outer membrane protein OmpA-like peptidoglycan-associated protein